MTPSRRLEARRAYGQAADAFDAVAWRPPVAQRFDPRVANDGYRPYAPAPTLKQEAARMPAWLHVVGGGLIAALMGALLGGALHV